jgi:type VI secretion system protein ImpA
MTTLAIFDFDRLLAPIPGESRTGVDLRADESHDSVYWQVKSARNESSRIERKHLEDPKNEEYSLSKRRWPEVVDLATQVLAGQSKDYEIAAWLCEGLLRQHSFGGLRDGFVLARRLAEQFWDDLYPGPKSEDRVSQFEGLLQGALLLPIRQVPITEGTEFSELDYDEAKRKGGPLLQQIEQQARQSSTEFLIRLAAELQGAIAELEHLAKVLKEKCGKDEDGADVAPSPRDVVKAMEGVLGAVAALAGDRLKTPPHQPAAAATAATPVPNGQPETSVMTRELAFKQLRELAEFFRKSDTHSFIAQHLDEAIRWGGLSLSELLGELISQESLRKEVFTRIGIHTAEKK